MTMITAVSGVVTILNKTLELCYVIWKLRKPLAQLIITDVQTEHLNDANIDNVAFLWPTKCKGLPSAIFVTRLLPRAVYFHIDEVAVL